MALSEFEIIRRFFTYPARSAVLGVGDDAAILRPRRGNELAASADMLVAGRHFSHGADPGRLGHKALAVNLSDMAAMGAAPRWVLLSVALPGFDARWLGAFMRGFMRLARRHGVELVGGDTTRGPLNISVQIIGEVPAGQALRRDGAHPGDDVWASGTLGDAALALKLAGGKFKIMPRERRRLWQRLEAPTPRVALGIALRGMARSAIDISDGLAADLGHVCERSQVSALVRFDHLPVSGAMKRNLGLASARAALLSGGDDYELLFTAARARRPSIERLSRRLRLKLTRIGEVTRRRGKGPLVTVHDAAGRPMPLGRTGYQHFQ